ESSAAAYSIIETAKANGLDPYLYLSTIFQYLPSQDLRKEPESIDKFLPWSDLMQELCKS
ncbi:MAG: transposase domain-containing protein, partial [Bacilli bacterium]